MYNRLAGLSTSSAYYNGSGNPVPVNTYICPSDPTNQAGIGAGWNLNNYNVNGMVFSNGQYPELGRSFSDGTSNTVAFVEHIALCRNPAGGITTTDGRSVWPAINLTTGDSIVYWPGISTTPNPPGKNPFNGMAAYQYSTAMIADPANGNLQSFKVPQANPTLGTSGTCDPLTANSMHSGTVQVGLADGSVRGVNPSITLKTWNAALTPAGGETLGINW